MCSKGQKVIPKFGRITQCKLLVHVTRQLPASRTWAFLGLTGEVSACVVIKESHILASTRDGETQREPKGFFWQWPWHSAIKVSSMVKRKRQARGNAAGFLLCSHDWPNKSEILKVGLLPLLLRLQVLEGTFRRLVMQQQLPNVIECFSALQPLLAK